MNSVFSSAASAKQTQSTSESASQTTFSSQAEPDAGSVQDFKDAIQERQGDDHQQGGGRNDRGGQEQQDSPESLFAGMGDAILQSRTQATMTNSVPAGIETTPTLPPELHDVAQQILVSSPEMDSEVLITLQHSALPDTAVKLSLSEAGLLVQFNTQDVNAHQTLVGNQHRLREALEAENANVQIIVNDQTGSDGRSKGLLDFTTEDDE